LTLLLEAVATSGDAACAQRLPQVAGDPRRLAKPFFVLVPRHLATLAALNGDDERARAGYIEAIEFCEAIPYRPERALTRFDLARLLLERFPRGRAEAHRHLHPALTEFDAKGMKPYFDRAQRLLEGRRPTLEPNESTRPGGPSERKLGVLRLLAAGKTNREIADELILSERTVQRHIADLYRQIDVRNRAEATAFAFNQLGL
jgi:DNA-binding CsgD family transcriptional regulator